MTDPRSAIRAKALGLGFDAVGFAGVSDGAEDKVNLEKFLALGRHGDMAWMKDRRGVRGRPEALWPEAKSAIVLGANYGPSADPLAALERRDLGAISVYAQGADYHDVLKKRLKALARWLVETYGGQVKIFVDTAPVMEKPLAERASAGWQGKHTNLVSREFGSWLFLGEVFTTLDLPPDAPHADMCGSCDRCLKACPTGALPEPYRIDATRCISYLTIEHKGAIEPELMEKMGNRIYGCDDCLTVCPWNKFAAPTREEAFHPRAESSAPRLADLARLDDAAFRKMFAGTTIKRTGRDRFVRNVLIAIGNAGDPTLESVAQGLRADPSPLVRGAATWAVGRLASPHPDPLPQAGEGGTREAGG
jgi:epoxyqueuosine reductase